jgi:3-phosphoshikimate 1-carboxyvinyltransferase
METFEVTKCNDGFFLYITSNPSKSDSQRLLAATLLKPNLYKLKNFGKSGDELAALLTIETFGAIVKTDGDFILIDTRNIFQKEIYHINIGESGLSFRLFTILCAAIPKRFLIDGKGSIKKRSINFIYDFFKNQNISIYSDYNTIPIEFEGGLEAQNLQIDAQDSSQNISGLLYAFAKLNPQKSISIEVENLVSFPYIDMTIKTLKQFGFHFERHLNKINYTGNSDKLPQDLSIEGCWSSAAYFLVAGAINGNVKIDNLDINSLQADRVTLDILKSVGAKILIFKNQIQVEKKDLKSFNVDATNYPDLIPILAILATFIPSRSSIKGLHRLYNKESNRAKAIAEQFTNIGIHFEIDSDTIFINGKKSYDIDIEIETYNDHRIAMAFSIWGLFNKGKTTILNPKVVEKSYPNFYNDLNLTLNQI